MKKQLIIKIYLHLKNKYGLDFPNIIFVGDLNQEEDEIQDFIKTSGFKRDQRLDNTKTPTWGGDTWCSLLKKQRPSKELTLDYAFIHGKALSIATHILPNYYDPKKININHKVFSDHNALFSEVQLGTETPN